MADKTLFTLETEAKNALTNFKLGVASQLDKIARERDTAIEQRQQAIDALRDLRNEINCRIEHGTRTDDACEHLQFVQGKIDAALLNLGEKP